MACVATGVANPTPEHGEDEAYDPVTPVMLST